MRLQGEEESGRVPAKHMLPESLQSWMMKAKNRLYIFTPGSRLLSSSTYQFPPDFQHPSPYLSPLQQWALPRSTMRKSESSLEGKKAWSVVAMGKEGFTLVILQAFFITHFRMYTFEWAFINSREDVAGLGLTASQSGCEKSSPQLTKTWKPWAGIVTCKVYGQAHKSGRVIWTAVHSSDTTGLYQSKVEIYYHTMLWSPV